MTDRPKNEYLPGLERLEEKRPLTAAATAALAATAAPAVDPQPTNGFLVYRITNPNKYNDALVPPFAGHVLVQSVQPVPGQTYNILQIAVRNGTLQTFNAQSGFSVRFPGNPTTYPILTGNEEWKPGQEFIFYVLTKKYYPLPNEVHNGFEFDLDGARSIGIPGPSGIFLRVKYNPATIDNVLDQIVARGAGSQKGTGIRFGIPDTAIDEFVSAQTKRNDFAGYF